MSDQADLTRRRYPDHPMIGVGVVVVRDGAILLVQRGRPQAYGRWAVPGGRVELGETARQAAAREALEESGVVVDVGDVIWVGDSIIRDAAGRIEYQYVLIDFVARYVSGEPMGASDALDVRWVREQDVAGLPLTATMPPLLDKVFAMIANGELT